MVSPQTGEPRQRYVRVHLRENATGGAVMADFSREESGQGLVEYALIIAVIAIAVIVAMIFLRDQISNIFSNIGNNLT
jgi:pilus assembly protein Flp/PilA